MARGPAGKNRGVSKISKWYKADDEATPFHRRQLKKAATTKLRSDIAPGTVLILLAGRFRGKRVVFLKQLKSGLLLVTGPYKVNGVPLKRVNQAYTLSTSTKVDITGVNAAKFEDAYFGREQAKKNHKNLFKAELTEEQKKKETERKTARKQDQLAVDTPLLAAVKKVEFLKNYLASKFTLSNNDRPHEMKF
ncbi:hypothetical protein ABPG74_014597 [Tetrahymena malaccensis]